ncbi:MAG: ATP-binding protein, partial [Bacteroidia bacterium]|nr:ATP-binding protein [Bacteroidia bacterium]
KKMNRFIEDLLEYSRLGRKEMDSSFIDPTIIINGLLDFYLRTYPDLKVNWELKIETKVYADSILLEMVLSNLLTNCVKYRSGQRPLTVSIRTEPYQSGILLTVADNGIGFNMEYHDRIFGIFKRLHSDAEYEGAGIGLANVQRIMHRHGGTIWAEAEEQGGAAFFCYFPGSK